MQNLRNWTAALILVIGLAVGMAFAGHWTGWIVDESCARKGIHAGDHTKHLSATNPAVFLNELDGKVFKLEGPSRAETLLGKHVAVEGKADGDAIAVESIMEIPAQKAGD
jgi:hypothetical protein